MTTTTCRSCNAPVVWVTTHKGESMPVDAEPVADGDMLIMRTSTGTRSRPFDPLLDSGLTRYVSHFSTCPEADQFRKVK